MASDDARVDVMGEADAVAATGDPGGGRASWQRRAIRVLPLLLAVAVFVVGAWNNRWMSDDGFIHLRIVEQIEAGNGPVFNAGERVEASTSPAWTWLLTALDVVLPFRLEWIAVITGIALSALGLWLAMWAAVALNLERDRDRGRDRVLIPAGGLVLSVLPAMWINATMGLENGLVFAWLGLVAWRLCRWASGENRLGWAEAVLVGAGTLVRPELALVTVVMLGIVVAGEWRTSRRRHLFGLVVAALALPIAYEVFRAGYYASLVPNSGIAKEASASYWSSGWEYLVDSVGPYALWFPVAVLLVAVLIPVVRSARRAGRGRVVAVALGFPAAGLLVGLFVIRVGGDFFHARLLLPPLLALLVPVAAVTWDRRFAAGVAVVPWAVLSLVWMRPGFLPGSLEVGRNPVTIDDYEPILNGIPPTWIDGPGAYVGLGRLDQPPPPGIETAVAAYGVGSIGYALGPDVYVLDQLGLGDALTARLELSTRGPVVGHEKPLPAPWTAARITAPGSVPDESDFTIDPRVLRSIDDPAGRAWTDRVADARATLDCGSVSDLDEAISEPLTVGRFLSNVAGAPGFTRLRIPPEPRAAREEFC